MPIKKAAFKHQRQTVKRTARNNAVNIRLKTLIKEAKKAITGKDKTKATTAVQGAVKKLDKAVQNKIIKKNTASRLKSRLTQQLNKLK